MPLKLKVEGDPATIRETTRWLQPLPGDIHDTGTQVKQAGTGSESGWTSQAGDSFRTVVTKATPRIDGVSEDHAGMCRELDKHADDLDTVKARMRQARQTAAEAGLRVNGEQIMEPGAEPPTPKPLPTDKPATPEQQQAHAAATQAQAAYARKVRAYQECSQVVTEARKLENSSLGALNRFISGLIEKSPFTLSDISTGLAGAVAARTSSFRAAATTIAQSSKIERAGRLMHSSNLSLKNQTRAAAIHVRNSINKADLERRATATRTARFVDRAGPRTKIALQAGMDFGKARTANQIGSRVLRGSVKVAGKLPVVGLGITAASIGYDAATGKDVGMSAASNLGGYAAGAMATAGVAMMGGPIGWGVAAGAVVSIGVGFAIQEWGDDVAGAVGDAGEAVGDFFGSIF